MNKTAIYSTIVVSVIASLAVFAVSSSEVEAVPPSKVACPAENVQHWETIAWSGPPIQHPTLPNVVTSFGTVKAQIDPNQAIDYQDVLISRLNELGYTLNGNPITIDDLNAQQHESEIICGQN